jgi:hypothetical protein
MGCGQGRREGGGVKYFRAKGKIFGFFWAKHRNLVLKIEVKSLEINLNVLVRKNFLK